MLMTGADMQCEPWGKVLITFDHPSPHPGEGSLSMKQQDYQIADLILALSLFVALLLTSSGRTPGF